MNSPEGSIWRKWDLHVHSPASVLNNAQFTGATDEDKWNNFYNKLRTVVGFSVIGITDYLSIDGYKKVVAEANLTNFDLILPNVELRILPVTAQDRPINLHVIFNPIIVDDLDSKFFSSLKFTYSGEVYKCIKTDLIKLGRKYKNDNSLVENTAYKAGVEQFKVTIEGLRDIFIDKVLAENSIIIVSNSSGDGNSGIQHSSMASTREEIYRLARLVFSSNPSDRVYFLGRGTDNEEEVKRKYGGLKACIWGSDSHDLENIGNPCAKRTQAGHSCNLPSSQCDMRFCWIKADPTFEGLKQIIYEPDERVRTQDHSPYEDRSKLYFNSIKLSGSTNFILPDFEVPLNRELIAIIGGRGSGKSALLDTFAFLNEEHLKVDRNNKPKIIEYYRENEGRSEPPPTFSLKTSLVDKDNAEHNFSKEFDDYTNLELPFLYLGQEQLSGIATNDLELTRTVCQLIGIDVNEVGQEDLISRARVILSRIENTEKQISDILQRYIALGHSDKVKLETWIKDYLVKLKEQQTRLSSKETRKVLEEINNKTKQGLKLKDLSEKGEVLLNKFKDISLNEDIKSFNDQLKVLYADFPSLAVLETSKQVKAIGEIQLKAKTDMDKLRKEIISQKQDLIKQGIKEDVNSLLQASENLQKQIIGIETDLKSFEGAQTRLKTSHEERNNLLAGIKAMLQSVKNAITTAFIEFQGSRSDSSQEEKELFEKMMGGIGVEGQIIFDEKVFAKKVLATYIDNRKISSEAELKKLIAGANSDGTSKEITFDNLAIWLQSNLISEKYFNRNGLKGFIEFVFTEWPSFLRLKAVAKLNGKPTEILSIGQRGTLLLKVYLATSTAKQVFVIDQPEDNLDNNFIMHELVPLIRRAKHSRQIIMSTHNANLVVNADAEQVMVALLDQGKSYFSGSIENPAINQAIKDTLEGGEQAFIQRERRYQIVS
jgi:ABC-type cobalamin/Fe3+-siderophores transport system ATPase subunit